MFIHLRTIKIITILWQANATGQNKAFLKHSHAHGKNASEIWKAFLKVFLWYRQILAPPSLPSPPFSSSSPSSSSSLLFNAPSEKQDESWLNSWDMKAIWRWILEAHFSPGPILVCPWESNGSSSKDHILGELITMSEALTSHMSTRTWTWTWVITDNPAAALRNKLPHWTWNCLSEVNPAPCSSYRTCIIRSSLMSFSGSH